MNTYPRIGYACMNLDIQPNDYKTCRKDHITKARLSEIIAHNLRVLETAIDYNIANGCTMFRISSSLIPFGSSPLNTVDWVHDFESDFKRISEKIINNKIRISVHPGQYTVLNSPDGNVVKASIAELEYHAQILQVLNPSRNSKMILHVGGIYGDKDSAIDRFIDVYMTKLSEAVKKHLVIENDDRLYTVEDVLYIASKTAVPVVFDNLHHEINPSLEKESMQSIVGHVLKTWSKEDGKPKMHYSQQAIGKRIGAHSDTIDLDIFQRDLDAIYSHGETDIMLEVKDKNRSFIKVDALINPSKKTLEREWAQYKYWVMARSQKAYETLRRFFRDESTCDVLAFYQMIDSLRDLPVDNKAQMNACQHVWGYFKNIATDREKTQYLKLMEACKEDSAKYLSCNRFLKKLAYKYNVNYLINSYYFD